MEFVQLRHISEIKANANRRIYSRAFAFSERVAEIRALVRASLLVRCLNIMRIKINEMLILLPDKVQGFLWFPSYHTLAKL